MKNNIKTYANFIKIKTGQGDYANGCLLFYPYLNDHYTMIAIDLRKQKALDADPKAVEQISSPENLDQGRNTTVF